MEKAKKVSIILFYNDNNEILLQERGSYSKRGEKWAFFGGHLEEGETGLDALYREAREEFGFNMNDFDYQSLGEHVFDLGDRLCYTNMYLIKTDLKETDFIIYEGASAKYFTIDDARKLEFKFSIEDSLNIIEEFICGEK